MGLKFRIVSALTLSALFLSACGSVATPRYEADAIIAEANREATAIVAEARESVADAEVVEATEEMAELTVEAIAEETEVMTNTPRARFEEVVVETEEAVEAEATEMVEVETDEATTAPTATDVPPTATTVPPTATSVPPTNTPLPTATTVPPSSTPLPTATTEAPVEEATEESAEVEDTEASASGVNEAEEERLEIIVDLASVDNGEALFVGGAVPACNTCHLNNSEERLVGPGMLNLWSRAGERVEGEGPYEYVYNSIRNSQAYIVPDYPAGVMINYTEDMLSDSQIYDLMAYLRTLDG